MGDNIKKIGIRNDSGEYTYTDIGVDADKVDIDNTTLDQKISTIEEDITKKVDKVEGKGLSSNDFTDEHLSIVETMSTGIVTGIKGNAEDDYRTGDVNLTAENIGALPVDGNAASATKAEQDGNGKVISDTYILRESILNSQEEIDANTSGENIAGALAVKEISKKMQNEMEASSNWVDITDSCNFGFVDIGSAAVYINYTLRLVSFWVAANENVNNQGTVFVVASLPSGSNPKILISSCDHTTDGVSVNLLTDGGTVKSSHSTNVSIANARYSGLIAF